MGPGPEVSEAMIRKVKEADTPWFTAERTSQVLDTGTCISRRHQAPLEVGEGTGRLFSRKP